MRVPRVSFMMIPPLKKGGVTKQIQEIPPLIPNPKQDQVSFGITISKYVKNYSTLPDEIKDVISLDDAIPMFQDMELLANGLAKRKSVGRGAHSTVYETPWLKDYYLLILNDTNYDKQTVYSNSRLGNSVWVDKDNPRIQIINKSA